MKLLVYPALDKTEVEILNINSEEEALREIEAVDTLYGTITPGLLERARKLKWIQTPSRGQRLHSTKAHR